ncbi:hypothetical protein [Mycobacterium sp. 1274761.0]|uniref:hypothetical protein n=1 Tax=Mycobacterium sp. 1274761.0 TaxID=1834077 RepID=UPI0007FDBA79|nr:hypothetical protein [Mycobacterium sp. 1274761.0]OBK77576.1 hypothetical protein A5651_04085 [Mycobacterium sp. 1274761.0]
MARLAEDDDIAQRRIYEHLLECAEEKFARHCGARVLVHPRNFGEREVITVPDPDSLLSALRARTTVTVSDWQVPRWARGDKVRNVSLSVHPDGRVVDEL